MIRGNMRSVSSPKGIVIGRVAVADSVVSTLGYLKTTTAALAFPVRIPTSIPAIVDTLTAKDWWITFFANLI